jgi:hypothetical protein
MYRRTPLPLLLSGHHILHWHVFIQVKGRQFDKWRDSRDEACPLMIRSRDEVCPLVIGSMDEACPLVIGSRDEACPPS